MGPIFTESIFSPLTSQKYKSVDKESPDFPNKLIIDFAHYLKAPKVK